MNRGEIVRYDKDRKDYLIKYDDGDSEDMKHRTVERYKSKGSVPKKNDNNHIYPNHATEHESQSNHFEHKADTIND